MDIIVDDERYSTYKHDGVLGNDGCNTLNKENTPPQAAILHKGEVQQKIVCAGGSPSAQKAIQMCFSVVTMEEWLSMATSTRMNAFKAT